MKIAFRLFLIVALCAQAFATDYYVDPHYTGATRNGTSTNPWQSLLDTTTNDPWTVINAQLASAAVTVYYAARPSTSDVDNDSTVILDVPRTDTSTNILTFDGISKYNTTTGTTAPNWVTYNLTPATTPYDCLTLCSGFKITAGQPFGMANRSPPYDTRSYITFHGMKGVQNGGKIFDGDGSHHVILEYMDLSSAPGTPDGPGVIFSQPLYQSNDCLTNPGGLGIHPHDIIIRHNYIHDTNSEGIYLGATTNDNPGCGYAEDTEQDVEISDNAIYNAGGHGGQGDGIDAKDGISGLLILRNRIWWDFSYSNSLPEGPPTDVRGNFQAAITLASGSSVAKPGRVEGNFVSFAPNYGITETPSWINPAGRTGFTFKNNFILSSFGIGVNIGSFANETVDNNTIVNRGYKNACPAFRGAPTTMRNNIFIGDPMICDDYNTILYAVPTTHTNNLYQSTTNYNHNIYIYPTMTPYSNNPSDFHTFEATAISDYPANLFIDSTDFTSPLQFRLKTGAVAIDAGATISPTFPDYFGNTRPNGSSWDVGAHEFDHGGDSTPPTPGTVTAGSVTTSTAAGTFTASTDNVTSGGNLLYKVLKSSSNNMTSVANANSNGTIVTAYATGLSTYSLTGLSSSTTVYVTVMVKDAASNEAVYNTVSQTTSSSSADHIPPVVGGP